MRNKRSEYLQLQPLAVVTYGFVAGVAAEKFGQWFDIPSLPLGVMIWAGLAALWAYLNRQVLESLKELKEIKELRMNRRESDENF